jgi:hypothetical protein
MLQMKKNYIAPHTDYLIVEKEFMLAASNLEVPKEESDEDITNSDGFEILGRENYRTNIWDKHW